MKDILKVFKNLLSKIKKFFKRDLRIVFSRLYLIGLVVSFIMVLLFATFPLLAICNDSLGFELCVPTGVFTGLIISIPGYLIAGNILARFENIHWLVSFFSVMATSYVFYYYFGLVIDKFKKADSKGKVKVIVVSIFVVLLVLLLYLI